MSKRLLFIIAAAAMAAAGIFFLSANAQSARTQAAAIEAADKAGEPTAAALDQLKAHVSSHMGTSVKVTLQGSYDRAVAESQAAAAAPSTSQIYLDAQKACGGRGDSVTQARCNEAYISSRLTPMTPTPAPVTAPVLANYQHDLKSPLWSPDLAGALLLGAAACAVAAVLIRKRKR